MVLARTGFRANRKNRQDDFEPACHPVRMARGFRALSEITPLEILRKVAIDGDPDRHLNEIYLPVEAVK
jgi:hypothetical protein